MTGRNKETDSYIDFTYFMDDEWRDKAFVQKKWNLQDEDLVDIVFKRILIPYCKRPDGVYMPLSYEIPSREEECAYHRWMNAWYPCNENSTRDMTEVDIRKELDSRYIWFRQCDLDEAEQGGKIAFVQPSLHPEVRHERKETEDTAGK